MILNPLVVGENGRSDVFSMNVENRIVLLTGEIEDEMASSVISQLLYLDNIGKETISLYINSPGGSVSAGLSIYDVMQTLRSPVSTICLGRAASMAAVILSGGAKGKRLVLPHSEVMIHQPSGGMDGQTTDLLIAATHIADIRLELNLLLAENCEKQLGDVSSYTERDHWMNADEAVKFGIADRIITKEE
ncbi:MAG: ATP-dependent Clp protease proteolytic subunit [Lachnospiraceae bacterium]|nr:ATP-dependent Clp protease proteolytic subunit [Lachnospiraceae bacterium]